MIGKRLARRTLGISSFQVMELLRRAKELEQQGRNVIHMEIGESDFTTPQHVVDAGMRQIRTGEIKYTPAAGLPELRESIAGFYRQRYGIGVDPARIFVTPGATGAFLLALGASINPGEEVLMSDPCYPCNSNFVHLFDGHTRTIPVDAASRYQLTAGLIRQHWTPATKGALIASPSNPTGTLIEPQELKSAVQAVDDLGGCFYSDEIYHGLEYGEKSTTALEFSDEVFVINSFSKYFNMTGWRIGWLVAPDEFLGAIEKLAQNIFISTPAHSQYAALAAFEEPTLIELERRRKEFAKRLTQTFIDGDFKGVSPITIPGLSPGTHKVLLTLKEYANTTTNISITGGQTQKYTAELQKVYTPSTIDLILAAGAIVMIAVIALVVMFRKDPKTK